jgi:hypothetical protein
MDPGDPVTMDQGHSTLILLVLAAPRIEVFLGRSTGMRKRTAFG